MHYTPKQMQIMGIISRSHRDRGYSPTYREIADEMQISPVTVYEHIAALEKKGAIMKIKHEARSIEVLDPEYDKSRKQDVELLARLAEAVLPLSRLVDEIEYDCMRQHGDKNLLGDGHIVISKQDMVSISMGDLRKIRQLRREALIE